MNLFQVDKMIAHLKWLEGLERSDAPYVKNATITVEELMRLLRTAEARLHAITDVVEEYSRERYPYKIDLNLLKELLPDDEKGEWFFSEDEVKIGR